MRLRVEAPEVWGAQPEGWGRGQAGEGVGVGVRGGVT